MTETQTTPPTTTDAGIPVESDEHSLTIGPDGPILLHDHYLIEHRADGGVQPRTRPRTPTTCQGQRRLWTLRGHQRRQCIHQSGDAPGTTTETVIRFSAVAGERGPDTWRDPRGWALKLYTTEGNYDIVGNNTPIFFFRDPLKFGHFITSQKRRADSNLRDQTCSGTSGHSHRSPRTRSPT